jgi:drug/metabolite transporter (DMT)-like permease
MRLSKAFMYTFLAAITWAISIVLLRVILQRGEDAYTVLLWTSVLALPFWIYLIVRSKNEFSKLKVLDYKILFGMGIISTVLVSITEFFALKYSPAINYAFLIRTVLLFTFLFAYLFLGETFTKKKIILASLMLLGGNFLSTKGRLIALSVGISFTLAEAALIAFGNNVLGKMATNRMSVNLSSSASSLIGFLPIVGISLIFSTVHIPRELPLLIILTILYITLNQLRYTAYSYAKASYVTMIFSFTPVFVSFMAIPFLKESMTPIQIVGGLLIVISGILVEKLNI